MSVLRIENDEAFSAEMAAAGDDIVVVDFSATWCMACQLIFPRIQKLATTYSNAKFLLIDVDKCPEVATLTGISILPTFVLYKNNEEIVRIEGSDVDTLEAKLQEQFGTAERASSSSQELIELNSFILNQESECLNESNQYPLKNVFSSSDGFLQSDMDEQLLMSLTFNQMVKIHSLIIKAPANMGPKVIKLFKNQPRTMDFSEVENVLSTQEIEISPEDLEKGNPINLRYVRFQNIKNIQIFVESNQTGSGRTQINYVGFLGRPIANTNLNELKPIVGTKVEEEVPNNENQ